MNRALGLVQFEGQWYTPTDLSTLLSLRARLRASQAQPAPQYSAPAYVYYPPSGYFYPGYCLTDCYPSFYWSSSVSFGSGLRFVWHGGRPHGHHGPHGHRPPH